MSKSVQLSGDGETRFGYGVLPSVRVLESGRAIRSKDITGAGTGRGAARVKVRASAAPCLACAPGETVEREAIIRRARAVGVGLDEQQRQAKRFDDWLAAKDCCESATLQDSRAELVKLVASARELPDRLMRLAGGRGWQVERSIGMNSAGCAARAARFVKAKRGVTPSDTSLDEAAQAATVAMFGSVRRWDKVQPKHWPTEGQAPTRLTLYLFRVGWRAAFHSLTDTGKTGDRANELQDLSLDAHGAATSLASLMAWAESNGVLPDTARAEARRAACSFIWRAIVTPVYHARGKGTGRTRQAARQRARFLMRLVDGETMADAAATARFASARAALESVRDGRCLVAMRDAAAQQWAQHSGPVVRQCFGIKQVDKWRVLPGVACHNMRARRAGLAAGRAVKLARALANGHGGRVDYRARAERILPCPLPVGARAISDTLAGRVAYKRAIDARERAVDFAKFARAARDKARAAHLQAFESALAGCRRAWLRD